MNPYRPPRQTDDRPAKSMRSGVEKFLALMLISPIFVQIGLIVSGRSTLHDLAETNKPLIAIGLLVYFIVAVALSLYLLVTSGDE